MSLVTNRQKNGRRYLSTTKEQVEQWDQILDEYENSIGLGQYNSNQTFTTEELSSYLNMSRTELEKLTPQDCAQIAFRLAQYSFFLQRTFNREAARHNWAEQSVKETIADDINNYKGYGFLEKSLQAIKHNDKASALSKIQKYAKQRMDRLLYLASSVKNLSDMILAVQKAKVANVT